MHDFFGRHGGRIFILKRKYIAAAATVLAVICIFNAVNSTAIVGAAAATRLLPIYCVKRDNKAVSLTFDAAWGNEDTQKLIDILGRYSVKATFFVVGEWVDKYPESVKALSDAGHEVMNHSDDHAHFAQLTAGQIISNVSACSEKIASVTGVKPTLFRPPYGEYDDNVIGTLTAMGMTAIQWDVDSLDWKEISAAEIYKRVTKNVGPGSIVLFHNAALHTPEALPDVISFLLQNGYDIVPVSELLLTGEFTIDHTGRQIPVS
ncbi:MAG: polysaccharide deacetylase family protein [Clostridiales bacterium]|nr:polysaccharide deacetylase family protein [Clostridiales bacterium]